MLEPLGGENQRGAKRFIVRNESYAILKQHNYSEMAKIVDISATGIGLMCLNEGEWDKEDFFLDIISEHHTSPDFNSSENLVNIPLRPIIHSSRKCNSPIQDIKMHRCGIRFGDLSALQKHGIYEYITKCA